MRNLLVTDAYKLSMAEAGWPLRTETFYYSHRKGGPCILPVDVKSFIMDLMPGYCGYEFLEANQYEISSASKIALAKHESIVVKSIPKFSVFYPGEPVFSVTGPSALVSWLEPLVLQLNFRIQIATMALMDPEAFKVEVANRNCSAEVELIGHTLDEMKLKAPEMIGQTSVYRKYVLNTAKSLIEAVEDPNRIFEVGLRSASCVEQHLIALEECASAGIRKTSNVFGAEKLRMTPVGTMGHEHVMRYGSDEAAFRAMRDRRPYRSSYLLDTYDTFLSGIPAAFRVMSEEPDNGDSIRYDSGNKEAQYLYAVAKAKEIGLNPVHILEDAFDLEQTKRFETLRKQVGVAMDHQVYGYGGTLVAKPGFGTIHRDKVAAVYKLSQTGPKAVMKFGNEPAGGKTSIPGKPVVWRRIGNPGSMPVGIIAQDGENLEGNGYYKLTDSPASGPISEKVNFDFKPPVWSPETKALKDELIAESKTQFC